MAPPTAAPSNLDLNNPPELILVLDDSHPQTRPVRLYLDGESCEPYRTAVLNWKRIFSMFLACRLTPEETTFSFDTTQHESAWGIYDCLTGNSSALQNFLMPLLQAKWIEPHWRTDGREIRIWLPRNRIRVRRAVGLKHETEITNAEDLRRILQGLLPSAPRREAPLNASSSHPAQTSERTDPIGKDETLAKARQILETERCVVIVAPSGYGKTFIKDALRAEALKENEVNKNNECRVVDINVDRFVTVDARGGSPERNDKALLEEITEKLTGSYVSDIEGNKKRCWDAVAAAGKILIALDNFVGKPLPYLFPPSGSGARLLMTARQSIDASLHELELPGWNTTDIADYLEKDPGHAAQGRNWCKNFAKDIWKATAGKDKRAKDRSALLVQRCLAYTEVDFSGTGDERAAKLKGFAERNEDDEYAYSMSFNGLPPHMQSVLLQLSFCPGWLDQLAIRRICCVKGIDGDTILKFLPLLTKLLFLHETPRPNDLPFGSPRPKNFYFMHASAKEFLLHEAERALEPNEKAKMEKGVRRRHAIHYAARLVAAGELFNDKKIDQYDSARLLIPHKRNFIDAQKAAARAVKGVFQTGEPEAICSVFASASARLCDLRQPNERRRKWLANAKTGRLDKDDSWKEIDAALCYAQAVVERYAGNLIEAEEHCARVLGWHLKQKEPDYVSIAEIFSIMGNLWMDRANAAPESFTRHLVGIADQYYVRALRLLEGLETNYRAYHMKGCVMGNHAIALVKKGFFRRARAQFDLRERIADELGDIRGLASAAGNRAMSFVCEWDNTLEPQATLPLLNRAEKLYFDAKGYHQRIDNKRGLAAVEANLALVQLRRGNVDEAQVGLERCSQQFQVMGDEQTRRLLVEQLEDLKKRKRPHGGFQALSGKLRTLHWADKYMPLRDFTLAELFEDTNAELAAQIRAEYAEVIPVVRQEIADAVEERAEKSPEDSRRSRRKM